MEKSQSQRIVGLLVVAVLFGGTAKMIQVVNQRLGELEVKSAPHVNTQSASTSKTFYPVWIRQKAVVRGEQDGVNVDGVFRKPELAKKEVKPVDPDYMAQLKQQLTLEGVANDGAFLNGHFYQVGQLLNDFAFKRLNGATVVPRLARVKGNQAVIAGDAGKTVTLDLPVDGG
jgi:hypothetical protein